MDETSLKVVYTLNLLKKKTSTEITCDNITEKNYKLVPYVGNFNSNIGIPSSSYLKFQFDIRDFALEENSIELVKWTILKLNFHVPGKLGSPSQFSSTINHLHTNYSFVY